MLRIPWWLMCGLVIIAGGVNVGAQQFTGGLRGAVSDANGVIPGVAVILTNEGTAIARDTTTNEAGQFNFSAVTPGTYTLRVGLPGFKTFERPRRWDEGRRRLPRPWPPLWAIRSTASSSSASFVQQALRLVSLVLVPSVRSV